MTILQKLTEEERYLNAILSDESGIDLVEFSMMDQTPGRPDPCYRLFDFQHVWWNNRSTFQIDQCVAKGSLITTKRGLIAIQDVRVGDLVLTHLLRWRPVTRTWSNGTREILQIRGTGWEGPWVTAEHPVYVKSAFTEPTWLPAGRLHSQALRVNAMMAALVLYVNEDQEARWALPTGMSAARSASSVFDLEVEEDHSFIANGVALHNCSRSIGKSESILARALAFPFCFPGQEMLITAPELNHLDPITSKIEERFLHGSKLARAMLPLHKGGGIKHQPQFQATFVNGARIVGRLPNRDGRGVKGQHPLRLEMDEAQDYPTQGWMEIIETMKHGIPGAQWRCHGVSRGVRDMYYRMTQKQKDVPFYVHKYPAMFRPTWSDEERAQKIAIYGGSRDNPDFKRNVLGEHGDVSNRVFVLARLMNCVRINESVWATRYNEEVYNLIKIEGESLEGRPIESFLTFPATHRLSDYSSYWAGMDLGFTNDPSELLVFGQIQQSIGGQKIDVLRLLTRIHLMRISAPDQERVIEAVLAFYGDRLRAISLDKTGVGLPIWQHMDDKPHVRAKVKGYGFSEKRAVMLDDRELVGNEEAEDAVISKNVIEFATEKLREYVDSKMIELPYDQELLTEFQGQTVLYSRDEGGPQKVRYGGGSSYHCVDPETEIMTAQGWRRYDEIAVGDEVLTLRMDAGTSRWSPIEEISIFDGPPEMVLMEGRGHSSLTTPNHRWPVRLFDGAISAKTGLIRGYGRLKWKTSATLTPNDGVLQAAPHDDFPTRPTHSDALVELMAWYWTEGNCTKSNTNITQNRRVHPAHCDRIVAALEAEFGPAGGGHCRKPHSHVGPDGCGQGLWHEYEDERGGVHFMLRREAGDVLRDLAPDLVVRPDFLRSLTRGQLDLFIQVSELGDGDHAPKSQRRAFQHQRDVVQNRALEMACALAGIATVTTTYDLAASSSGTSSTTALYSRHKVRPAKFRTVVPYEGLVWCPRTRDGNWLARRKGTVYWTGNTLDAAKLMMLGKELEAMEELMRRRGDREPVLDSFGYGYGG